MKIRNGFVSNSSSSSFCIYGTCMEIDEIMERMKNTLSAEDLEQLEEEGDWYIEEILSEKTNLSVHQSEGTVWIGESWTMINDDQTGGEFKADVKAQLEKVLGPDVDCDTHEEEIYN